MILVCPSCDAKFKVPDGAIPAGGRTVRCAKCKNSWHAAAADVMRKPAAPRKVATAAPGPAARRQPAAPGPAARRQPATVPFDGELDTKAANDAAALRRSVRGTIEIDDQPTPAAPAEDTFGEEVGVAAPGIDTDSDTGTNIDTDDAGRESEGFGVVAALKKTIGDKFEDTFFRESEGSDDLDDDEDYDEDDYLVQRRANQRRQSERHTIGRQRKLMTYGAGGLIFFWLAVFYVFVFQQENMRHYFPGTSNVVYGIFSGLDDRDRYRPGEGETLTKSAAETEEYVRALLLPPPNGLAVETRSGQQGLMLRGFVQNAGTTGANVPQVRAFILDKNGKTLDSWTFKPVGLILRKGGKVDFEEFRTPIPAGANKAEVKVIEGSKAGLDARDEE